MDIISFNNLMHNLYISLLILIVFWLIIIISNYINNAKLNNRFKAYTLPVMKDVYSLDEIITKYIKKLSNIFSYSRTVCKLNKKYEKYENIVFGNYTYLDYFSLKVVSGFSLMILVIFSNNLFMFETTFFESLLIFGVGFIIPSIYYKYVYNKNKDDYQLNLSYAIRNVLMLLKEDYSVVKALEETIKNTHGLIRVEFQKVIDEINMGVDIVSAFKRLELRMNDELTSYLVNSIIVMKQTSVDKEELFKIINKLSNEIQNKNIVLNESVKTHSFIINVCKLIPLCVVLICLILNPNYYNLLLSNIIGRVVLIVIVIVYIIYVSLLNRVLKVGDL